MYKVGMWKKLVALSMIVILGVSAVVVASLQTGHQAISVGNAGTSVVDVDASYTDEDAVDEREVASDCDEAVSREAVRDIFYNIFAKLQELTGEKLDIAGAVANVMSDNSLDYDLILEMYNGQEQDSFETPQSRFIWWVSINVWITFTASLLESWAGWAVGLLTTAIGTLITALLINQVWAL